MAAGLPTLLCVLLAPAPARADPAMDAAVRAHEANEEHCVTIYGGGTEAQASEEHYPAITAALAEVSAAYSETAAPYLLYWRGTLYQCLNNTELAKADFEAFIASGDGGGMFADLIRQAQARLRRLTGKERLGQGAAAGWIRRPDALEARLRYVAGVDVRGLACTDPGPPLLTLNARCGAGTSLALTPVAAPVGVAAALVAWPVAVFGVGGHAALDLSLRSDAVDPPGRAPGPRLSIAIGPRVRSLGPATSGRRAGALRVEPSFAVSFGQATPIVGNAAGPTTLVLLDAGVWSTAHVGFELALLGEVEVAQRALLFVDGRFSAFPPHGAWATPRGQASDDATEATTPAAESSSGFDEIVIVGVPSGSVPGVVRSQRYAAGASVGALFPVEGRNLAVGPVLDFGWSLFSLEFPNDPGDAWCSRRILDGRTGDAPDCGYTTRDDTVEGNRSPGPRERKVYSTRRQDFFIRLGVELRFGVGE